MKVTVFDEEAFKAKHDLVGEVTIDMAKILAGETEEQIIEIKYKNKKAGDVTLQFDVMSMMSANVGAGLLAGLGLNLPNAQNAQAMQMQQQPQYFQ